MEAIAKYWFLAFMGVVLLVAAIVDVRKGKIYNWITYPAIAVGLIGHTLFGGLGGSETQLGLAGSLAGLAVGFGLMFVAWLAGGIGGGDVKLMAAVGALGGWRFALAAMFYGFAVAALMALVVMLHQRILRKTLGRVFRFVFLLAVRAKPGDPAGEDSPKVAFGVALCIGAALAVGEVLWRGVAASKLLLGI